jgi:hypothetical protein
MPTKLSLYNGALRILGERKLASLTEAREPRRKLDEAWDADALNTVLQAGQWNFGARSTRLESDPSITPEFGYQYAFEKPSDFVRVMGVCQDGYYNIPLTRYSFEGGYWYADLDQIFVRYVSNDAQYGADYSLWPPNFTRYAEAYLAELVAMGITQSADKKLAAQHEMKRWLTEAAATDAMEQPVKFKPAGSWSSARRGGRSGPESTNGTLLT